ncbi:Uncharacterised protein [Mycobacterium tuberculosis]|nr:Uncharacterised protein [Mycobacterium tuberculosis]
MYSAAVDDESTSASAGHGVSRVFFETGRALLAASVISRSLRMRS